MDFKKKTKNALLLSCGPLLFLAVIFGLMNSETPISLDGQQALEATADSLPDHDSSGDQGNDTASPNSATQFDDDEIPDELAFTSDQTATTKVDDLGAGSDEGQQTDQDGQRRENTGPVTTSDADPTAATTQDQTNAADSTLLKTEPRLKFPESVNPTPSTTATTTEPAGSNSGQGATTSYQVEQVVPETTSATQSQETLLAAPTTTLPSLTTTTILAKKVSDEVLQTTRTITQATIDSIARTPTEPLTTTPAATTTTTTIGSSDSGAADSTPTATTTAPTTQPTFSTQAPTTQTSAVPQTSQPQTSFGSGRNQGLEALRNDDPMFSQFASVRSSDLNLDDLTTYTSNPDNGSVGDGQFRAACQYSHFAYDDPIIYPNQPGASHLHMFFGNTNTNAFSTTDSLVNSGGGTCNGFELNRSAYWTPALLDGQGNAVVPDSIILYYKSKYPGSVQRMPQGLRMVAGNTTASSFSANQYLMWQCGGSGSSYNTSNQIPNCNGDRVNATISFPECWDGRNLDSPDHKSHMYFATAGESCPSSHPVRLPRISILLYFPGQESTAGWHLSSDGPSNAAGSTLHADWWGGWNDETMDLWTQGCMRNAKNCSFGQTGTNRQLARVGNRQAYEGPNFLPLP